MERGSNYWYFIDGVSDRRMLDIRYSRYRYVHAPIHFTVFVVLIWNALSASLTWCVCMLYSPHKWPIESSQLRVRGFMGTLRVEEHNFETQYVGNQAMIRYSLGGMKISVPAGIRAANWVSTHAYVNQLGGVNCVVCPKSTYRFSVVKGKGKTWAFGQKVMGRINLRHRHHLRTYVHAL